MIISQQLGMVFTALLFLAACAPQTFEHMASNENISQNPNVEEVSSNFFQLSDSKLSFQQDVLDQNQTSLTFQVQLPDGTFLNDLLAAQLLITENGVPVRDFKLTSNSQKIVQTVDIVFAVDVTGSMAPVIESAKARLISFARTSRQLGYHTRMCLITFGDYTVQHCNKFYDNNPADPATESQVAELISEISKLRALKDKEDPGGADANENPMRALIDASQAPFSMTSQRFLIMITDNGFLHSPSNSGTVGVVAPKYSEVMAALKQSQMKVFAVTPSLPGYDQPFKDSLNPMGQPGVVAASQGEFFLFADLFAGKITLDTLLNRIILQAKTTYHAEYNADEVPGLDSTLPLNKRKFEITLANGQTATVTIASAQSNLPTGRPEYKKKWKLGGKDIRPTSLTVRINGALIKTGYRLESGELIFDLAPPRGAKIEVAYLLKDLKDSLMFSPITLSPSEDLDAIFVLFNGIKALGPDVFFEKTLEGGWTIRPSDKALAEDDPFKIRERGGLEIKVQRAK